MTIEGLLEDIQKKQAEIAEQRVVALNHRHQQRAEALRMELKELLDLEDRFLGVLADAFNALNKRAANIRLPKRAGGPARPNSRTFPPGTKLETSYKGKTIKAVVNKNGKILFGGKLYNSIAAVSQAVTGKEKNHLRNRKFWGIEFPEED